MASLQLHDWDLKSLSSVSVDFDTESSSASRKDITVNLSTKEKGSDEI